MPLDCYDLPTDPADGATGPARPYIGILFECCGVYARVYRRPERMLYEGRCPKCLRKVRARVGRDGVATRIFRAR